MMLRGSRLLLRAVLLLGTARCSPAAPDSEWSPETPGHPAPTPAPAWGAAAGTSAPREEASAGREGLMMEAQRLRAAEVSPAESRAISERSGERPPTSTDPNRTGTDPPSEPNRTGTDPPSEPNRTGTDPPSEPNRIGTDPPSEPNRTGTDPPSEPNRTGTDPPSEPNRTGTDPPSELNRTGTDPPSEPNRTGTDPPSEPNRTGTDPPSEPNRTGTDPPSEPNRTGTDPPSEPNRTGTDSPSEPNRTGTDPPSEPNRTGTDPPSEPNRTGTDSPSEPNRTGTDPPSEPSRTGTDPPSERNRTGTDPPSEPNRTGTDPPSEPNRTGTDPPSEPNRTGTDPPSEPNRTGTDSPSEPNRTGTDPPSEPSRTGTDPPSERNRTGTDPPSEPNRTGTDPPSEPNRTGTDPPSEPNRTGTDPPSEPNRTGADPPSEPNRTGTDPPSEPNRTGTDPPSEPNRTGTDPLEPNRTGTDPPSGSNRTESPSLSADIGRTQTLAESGHTEHHLGPHIYYRSEPDGRETTQTSSAAGIIQKSATQRHLNKRTPHMDTTYISSTRGGDRTLLSVTNGSNTSDITEIPNTYVTGTGDIIADSPSTVRGGGNATERNMSVHTATSVPGRYPSYVVTTDPSTTVHQVASSTIAITRIPATAPNTRSGPKTPGVTVNTSSIDLWLPSSSVPPSAATSTAASSPPRGVSAQSFQPPSLGSSSSSISTLDSSASPPNTDTTETFHRSTAMSSTPRSPAPSTTLPPSLRPESTPGSETTPVSSVSPSNEVSTANYTIAIRPQTPPVLTERGSHNETTQDVTTTVKPRTTGTEVMSSESTWGDTARTHLMGTPTQTGDNSSSTTSSNIPLTPSQRDATQKMSHDTMGTVGAGSSTMTTTDQVVVTQTPQIHPKTEVPGPNTTVSTKTLPYPTPPSTTPAVRYSATTLPTALTTTPPRSSPTTTPPRSTPSKTPSRNTPTTTPPRSSTTTTPPRSTPSKTPSRNTPTTTPPRSSPTKTPSGNTPTRTPPTPPAAVSLCASGPCHNGGLCVESSDLTSFRCDCPVGWSDDLCSTDVDECLSSPCPVLSTCVNSRGSFSCQCPLGYLLEKGAGCVLVRTFLGHVEIPWSFLGGADVKDSGLHQIKEDIARILNSSFSTISGYYQSTVTSDSHTGRNDFFLQNLFSLESNVTMFDLLRSLQSFATVCESAPQRPRSCQLVLHLQHRIRALSLCHVRSPGCDNETAACADPAGVAFCQCKPGYFKYSKTDHSCRACDDGYKLDNGACVRCLFGLGGFNCSNPYQLITVIIAAAGGGLLLVLTITLAVTCCRKSKHDISKLIFKSGDFQMSPYAEYPKTSRSSEWGRETIEMQENGSTKNLLQMTDIYYSPGLRNAEMERSGLYPYSGLPGSRHSCIYPGQYNPSFINEDNRRRDYF
ncbi:protein HEG homolog 1 [Phyllobates terribilis]|uniref:protein HEG homolog 1 n=1 Tax=Phyllobates terribilis TaxID=111132 RepID=UPI003CCB3881